MFKGKARSLEKGVPLRKALFKRQICLFGPFVNFKGKKFVN
jgi:hypothetical protein